MSFTLKIVDVITAGGGGGSNVIPLKPEILTKYNTDCMDHAVLICILSAWNVRNSSAGLNTFSLRQQSVASAQKLGLGYSNFMLSHSDLRPYSLQDFLLKNMP